MNGGTGDAAAPAVVLIIGRQGAGKGVQCTRLAAHLPADQYVISASHTDRQTTLLVRTDAPIHDPSWSVSRIGLEDLVLAYMTRPADAVRDSRPTLEVLR